MKKELMYAMCEMEIINELKDKFGEVVKIFSELEEELGKGISGRELISILKRIKKEAVWLLNHNECNTEVINKETGEVWSFHIQTVSDEGFKLLAEGVDAFISALIIAVDDKELSLKTIDTFLNIFSELIEGILKELIMAVEECLETIEELI